jgi:hypothetical protein
LYRITHNLDFYSSIPIAFRQCIYEANRRYYRCALLVSNANTPDNGHKLLDDRIGTRPRFVDAVEEDDNVNSNHTGTYANSDSLSSHLFSNPHHAS